jgi:DNA repair exonuclease SbcCD ATPase subunit
VASPEHSPSPEPSQWSSAIGHASTGKSGRVIERLQGDIDRLHRDKQLLKMRHEEVEKANETLVTRNQYLQDRNSNYEHSHEANLRQIARRERQLEELKDELKREREKTSRAEEQAQAASRSEEEWKDQAHKANSIAAQRESEYDAMVSCRTMDNDRHQKGLDKLRSSFEVLMRQRDDDLEKQKKLEIIAEQQRQTIGQLEELTKKLNANFKAYRMEIDNAIHDLRSNAQGNDVAMKQRLDEMVETTGRMRWVMKVDEIVNGNPPRPGQPPAVMSKETLLEHGVSEPESATKSPTRMARAKLVKKMTKSGR